MDATTNYALRVVILIVIGGGLPAAAIFGKFPGPTHAIPPSLATKTETPPAIATAIPRAKVTSIEAVASDADEPSMVTASIPSPPTQRATLPPHAKVLSAKTPDRLTQVQERLKQLGAYYFLLESMTGDTPSYRFHAAIGSGPSDSTGRRFEVTDTQPMRAMERVLAEVEQWSNQRLSLRGNGVERK